MLLAGCAQVDLTPKTLQLRFLVDADQQINPNEQQEPSPVLLRIYELKSVTQFLQAQFFELLDNDTQKLGTDLVAKREFELKPGDKQEFARQTPLETRHIGVVAGFRAIDVSRWRAVTELDPDRGTNVVISVRAQSVDITTSSIRRFGLF
jgi:type VI secretion system protein VasD